MKVKKNVQKKKKKPSLTGFSKEETPNRIKNMENITFWWLEKNNSN